MALGLLGATYKSAVAIKAQMSETRNSYKCLLFVSPNIIGLGVVLWTSAKIYFAFQCDSHRWNLTSGCMHH